MQEHQTAGSSRDPQFKFPRAVEARKRRREEWLAEQERLRAGGEDRPDDSGTPAAPNGHQPPANASPQPSPAPPAPTDEASEGTPSAGRQPAAAPAGDPESRPPKDRTHDADYWRRRHLTTQGMLDRERQDRRADAARHRDEVTRLQAQLDEARAAAHAPAGAPAPAPAATQRNGSAAAVVHDDDVIDITELFTPAQIEAFGEEQCQTIARGANRAALIAAKRAAEAAVKPLKERQEREDQQRKDEEQERLQRNRNAFYDQLGELVPDFQGR